MLCLCLVMNKQLKFQECAVGKRTSNHCVYYFEVPKRVRNFIDRYEAGVYSSTGYVAGYVTKNEKLMKEFMWIKLKAKELRH